MDRQPIISAKDVEITFSLRGRKLNAIRKCSLDLYEGETLAIVGVFLGDVLMMVVDPRITLTGKEEAR